MNQPLNQPTNLPMTLPVNPPFSPQPPRSGNHLRPVPDNDAIALLPAFERLGPREITLVSTGDQARKAQAALAAAPVWGFDTESKPTFRVGELSDGPHVVQLATRHHAWVFQLHEPDCRAVVAALLAQVGPVKAGFGLGDQGLEVWRTFGFWNLVEPA